jgi:hypothetical protein
MLIPTTKTLYIVFFIQQSTIYSKNHKQWCPFGLNRESGENPELPPQLYVRTKWSIHCMRKLAWARIWEGSKVGRSTSQETCLAWLRFMFSGEREDETMVEKGFFCPFYAVVSSTR